MTIKAFMALDKDKGGHLDEAELASFAEKVGGKSAAAAAESAKAFLESADEDSSGCVDPKEFVTFCDDFFDEDDEVDDVVSSDAARLLLLRPRCHGA